MTQKQRRADECRVNLCRWTDVCLRFYTLRQVETTHRLTAKPHHSTRIYIAIGQKTAHNKFTDNYPLIVPMQTVYAPCWGNLTIDLICVDSFRFLLYLLRNLIMITKWKNRAQDFRKGANEWRSEHLRKVCFFRYYYLSYCTGERERVPLVAFYAVSQKKWSHRRIKNEREKTAMNPRTSTHYII